MPSQKFNLPFIMPDLYSGLAEAAGMLHLEEEEVWLEFQVKDAMFGLVKSPQKEITIPLTEISTVTYKANWFVSRLRIQVNSISILEGLPGGESGEIKLKIKRKHKNLAKNFTSYLNLRLSEMRLDSW